MKQLDAAALDGSVVNARRRFRRVLAAWASDLLSLESRTAHRVSWQETSASQGH